MNSSTEILKILKEQKIKSVSDIDNYSLCSYPSNCYANSDDSIRGKDKTWIGDIFNIIKKDMEYSNKQLLADGKKYITFSEDSDDTLKYACMFPEMSINLKEKFDELQTSKGPIIYTMPKNFFRSMITHKTLVQEGVYKLLPEIIKATDDVGTDYGEYSTWSLSGKREYYQDRLEKKLMF